MEQDPTEYFSLTEEMINSIKNDVIPEIKGLKSINLFHMNLLRVM